MTEAPADTPDTTGTPTETPTEAPTEVDGLDALRDVVALAPGETLERVYRFEPLERREARFTLALVTVRLPDGRLELVAIGGRTESGVGAPHEFVRRARFPEEVLPKILEELADRASAEATWREIALAPPAGADPIAVLAEALLPGPE